MCTVTFVAQQQGYVLGMNRDEKLDRVSGLAPEERFVGGQRALCPSEPGGGTWIGVNEAGVGFALINWYAIQSRASGLVLSRGGVVMACLAASDRTSAEDALGSLPLRRMNPFRMIAVFPKSLEVIEWRWDRERLAMESMGWRTGVWISSGLDEPRAQKERGLCFEQACQEQDSGSLDWLRRFHQSHRPERGPYSVCMHREDAATVSYTEIGVEKDRATLRHSQGALCQWSTNLLELQLARVGN